MKEKIDGRRAFVETYRKIRKKMPPPEKTIKPHNEEDDKFDWRKEIDGDEDDYKGIGSEK